MKTNHRVIISGCGPVGAVMTLALVKKGIPVMLIEQLPDAAEDQRAATIHTPTVEMLVDLGLEALGHACVALGGREVDTLLKRFDRARYVALAEKGPGFAKDASIALAFCGGIHEDYRK